MINQILGVWKAKVIELKVQVYALHLAYKDPRVPRHARIFAAGIVGYALSPIDLIPDFIPIIGYLDDLVIVPVGIALAVKMIPANVMAECQESSRQITAQGIPVNKVAAVIIFAIWLLLAVLVIIFLIGVLQINTN